MRKLLIGLFLLVPIITFGQKAYTSFTISGKIIDGSTKEPIELATIIFKNTNESEIKHGGITNSKGYFSIDVKSGAYDVSIEIIGYKTKKLNISSISKNINLSVIELEIDTELLAEIEVLSEKRTIEFKPNKIVYNIERDASAAGSSATDILNNIPSVSVDPNGSITLRGQNNVTVMINGKISSMTKTEVLNTLPSGNIEKIEVIANPGAKYKASSLGIINIILKKGKDEGLNGSITASGGFKDYYGGLLTLNNKYKVVNFFTSIGYLHRNPVKIASYENEYFPNGLTTSFLEENIETNSKDNAINTTIGADFNLSTRTVLTTTLNYSNITNNSITNTGTSFFDKNYLLTSINDKIFTLNDDYEIVELNLDFEHNFKKDGQQLKTSIVYSNDEENSVNSNRNSNINIINENFIENNTIKNTIIDFQFTNPIKETLTLTIGYKGEFSKLPFTYEGTSPYSNILYQSKVNAAFIDFENQGKKFYYGIGLRAESSSVSVDYEISNEKINKKFDDLFPSAHFEYKFNDSNSLSLGYSKKTERPGYYQLLPYEQKFSETVSYKGNEKLNPYYVDKINLSYVYSNNKLTIAPSLFYDMYEDWFEIVTYETGDLVNGINKLLTTFENVGSVNYYGIDLTTTYRPNNVLNFTSNIFVLNIDQSGVFETINNANEIIIRDYNQSIFTTYISFLTQIKIPKLFDFQTNIKHDLISKGNFYTRRARTHANIAINKDLFDKDASISLTIDDVFLSNKTDRDRFDTNYFSKTLAQNKYRTILLSFTYRFNQSKKDRKINFNQKEINPNF